jgi:hypothetical protein
VGAKEQSGRTWPSIFWARGTLPDKDRCITQSRLGLTRLSLYTFCVDMRVGGNCTEPDFEQVSGNFKQWSQLCTDSTGSISLDRALLPETIWYYTVEISGTIQYVVFVLMGTLMPIKKKLVYPSL